jgi:hypothetical protein
MGGMIMGPPPLFPTTLSLLVASIPDTLRQIYALFSHEKRQHLHCHVHMVVLFHPNIYTFSYVSEKAWFYAPFFLVLLGDRSDMLRQAERHPTGFSS